MIHTVKIDDSTRNGKKIITDLRRYRKGVEFENPAETGIVPEGYVTSEEFRKTVKENLLKKFSENGNLISQIELDKSDLKWLKEL